MKTGVLLSSILSVLIVMASSAGLCGVLSKGEAGPQLQPAAAPEMIYVADFDIDSGNVQQNSGPLKGGILGREGPLQSRRNQGDTAPKLVQLMSESLARELSNCSLRAVPLSSGGLLPRSGWVVRGEFTEVDEGNRVRRAVVGFGSGATHMQVEVNVADLGTYPDTPFLLLGTDTGSGKMPGAVVTMNPYVAAAKFVMAKNASDKDVRHTAKDIADAIVKYMQEHGLMAP